jgi:hypothetical protein
MPIPVFELKSSEVHPPRRGRTAFTKGRARPAWWAWKRPGRPRRSSADR